MSGLAVVSDGAFRCSCGGPSVLPPWWDDSAWDGWRLAHGRDCGPATRAAQASASRRRDGWIATLEREAIR